jgi:hypothetical protein
LQRCVEGALAQGSADRNHIQNVSHGVLVK